MVNGSTVRCGLCNSKRAVHSRLTSTTDVTLITRSTVKPGTFHDAIRRHVNGSAHQSYREAADASAGPRQTHLTALFSRSSIPSAAAAALVTSGCCGFKGSVVTIPYDGWYVEMDPQVLLSDSQPGRDADGNIIWFPDVHQRCFRSRYVVERLVAYRARETCQHHDVVTPCDLSNCAQTVQVLSSLIPDDAEGAWRGFCCRHCLSIPETPSFRWRLSREHANSGDPTRRRGGRSTARSAGKVPTPLVARSFESDTCLA